MAQKDVISAIFFVEQALTTIMIYMVHVVDMVVVMVMVIAVMMNLSAVVLSMPIVSNFLRVVPYVAISSVGGGKR